MTYSTNEPSTVTPVARTEEDKVARDLCVWLNSYPELPVSDLDFETLYPGREGMCLSLIQGKTFVTKRYILGGHMAECHFGIIYRIIPGESQDLKLHAVETLDKMGEWAYEHRPKLGAGVRAVRCEPTTRAACGGVQDNGDEDYQILMKLTYEVI